MQSWQLWPLLIKIVLEVLSRAIRQERKIEEKKKRERKEEVSLSLLTDDMSYTEETQRLQPETAVTMRELGKVAGLKKNTHKN